MNFLVNAHLWRAFPRGRYPFLLNAFAKRRLLSFDVELRTQVTSQEIWAKTLRSLVKRVDLVRVK
jgi:hypothetical protein